VGAGEQDDDAEAGGHLGDRRGIARRCEWHEKREPGPRRGTQDEAVGFGARSGIANLDPHRNRILRRLRARADWEKSVAGTLPKLTSEAETNAGVTVQLAQRCGIGLRTDRAVDVDETWIVRQGSI
jgi:hypothetical protein